MSMTFFVHEFRCDCCNDRRPTGHIEEFDIYLCIPCYDLLQ